jgi:hypothetical protein
LLELHPEVLLLQACLPLPLLLEWRFCSALLLCCCGVACGSCSCCECAAQAAGVVYVAARCDADTAVGLATALLKTASRETVQGLQAAAGWLGTATAAVVGAVCQASLHDWRNSSTAGKPAACVAQCLLKVCSDL